MEKFSLNPPSQTAVALMTRFKRFYENFSVETLDDLDDIYTPDIEFLDPLHRVHGLLALRHYMRRMAGNLSHYRIRYLDTRHDDESAYVSWEMEFRHPRLARGRLITLRGMSHLRFTQRVYYHEDSYDLGAMLYEHLPVVGALVRSIRKRAARQD